MWLFCAFKSELLLEVWDDDLNEDIVSNQDDIIDKFTVPISNPCVSNQSNPLTVQGDYGLVNLTLNYMYGNLTVEPTSCSSATEPLSTTSLYTPEGEPTC